MPASQYLIQTRIKAGLKRNDNSKPYLVFGSNIIDFFPRTKLIHDENNQFKGEGLDIEPWQSTTQLREIVKNAFELVGFSYHNPHSFRNTIVRLAYEKCKTPEDFKARSQNLGHNSPLTTFTSYGDIDPYKQDEVIKRLGSIDKDDKPATLSEIKALINKQNNKNT